MSLQRVVGDRVRQARLRENIAPSDSDNGPYFSWGETSLTTAI